jgi:hypothetical protein
LDVSAEKLSGITVVLNYKSECKCNYNPFLKTPILCTTYP